MWCRMATSAFGVSMARGRGVKSLGVGIGTVAGPRFLFVRVPESRGSRGLEIGSGERAWEPRGNLARTVSKVPRGGSLAKGRGLEIGSGERPW